ncbi:hypothetical protein EHF_0114 [Ehrlichia japonica]|uniref:Uncharacterized protein n=1 Tax=Ehrlichia japonica TaxID=391036 RepID=X5GL32_9RICK|nr:hypothetical protein EHF_0114 [Ehrlichia japonica]
MLDVLEKLLLLYKSILYNYIKYLSCKCLVQFYHSFIALCRIYKIKTGKYG